MSIRMQLTPDDFLRAKLVKPGWYATLIKTVVEELNSKKDANNVVLDCENADPESEFRGVPVKHWLSEKGVSMAGGAVSLAKAFDPKMKEDAIAEVEFEDKAGRYIYAKWETSRGKDGQEPPRNVIVDWAPLPAKLRYLDERVTAGSAATAGVGGFSS
jgi:hypothetical protein